MIWSIITGRKNNCIPLKIKTIVLKTILSIILEFRTCKI